MRMLLALASIAALTACLTNPDAGPSSDGGIDATMEVGADGSGSCVANTSEACSCADGEVGQLAP